MAQIPTVSGTQVDISTPQRGAMLNPSAFQLREGAFTMDPNAANAPARATLAAVDARYRGKREVAGALENVGEGLRGIADDMLKVQRARIASNADFRMRTAQQTFLESLRGDQDEHTWTQRAQDTSDRVASEIMDQNIPPGMQQELRQSLSHWSQALQIDTGVKAMVQSIKRAEIEINKDYDEAARGGDATGMANAVAAGRSAKLDAVKMDELEKGIPRALALTAIENGIRVNPQGVHDLLASGEPLPIADQHGKPISPKAVFPPKELANLQNTARVQAAAWQKTNAEDLLQTAADPITGMVPDGVIEQKMQSKEISQAFGRSLLASQTRKQKADSAEIARMEAKDDRELFSYVTASIRDTTMWEADPAAFEMRVKGEIATISDPALRKRAMADANMKIAAVAKKADDNRYDLVISHVHDATAWGAVPEVYAQSLVSEAAGISDKAKRQAALNTINHQLEAVKKQGSLQLKPVEEQIYSLIKRDLAERSSMVPIAVADIPAKTRLFGANEPARTEFTPVMGGLSALKKMDDIAVEATFGKGVKKEDVIRAAEVHSAQIEGQMREWFKSPQGQKATFDQANAHLMEIEKPFVLESVKATLSKRAPMIISTQEEYNALPSGAMFAWKDKNGVIRAPTPKR